MSAWVGVLAFSMLVWFGLDAWRRTSTRWRDKSAQIDARLEVFEAAHTQPEGEQ